MKHISIISAAILSMLASHAGCANPTLMPVSPLSVQQLDGQGMKRLYDGDRDGRADYGEVIPGTQERVSVILIDSDTDGELDLELSLASIDPAQCRHLLLIIDSVPYRLVQELWQQGRFRLFHAPSKLITPFPVMTDLCLAEFFGVSPCKGVESSFYDGQRRSNGYTEYWKRANAPWLRFIDSYINPWHHGSVYLFPYEAFEHELAGFQRTFLEGNQGITSGYSVASSAIGSRWGRDGHHRLLTQLDRFCQSLMKQTAGKIQITLMSDHGHDLSHSEYFSLHKRMQRLGYRDADRLSKPNDIVITRFGPVTCASIYTLQPTQVAADAVSIEGVQLAFYREGENVIVRGRSGIAEITRRGDRYRYTPIDGDPLELRPIIQRLHDARLVDDHGYIADTDLFKATVDHVYPDPLHRLWRAFDGLIQHTPQVLLSLDHHYCYGTSFFRLFIDMESAHGSLDRRCSIGFMMTTAGPLPSEIRMEKAASFLREHGLKMPPSNDCR